jgi:cobalamin biosynthesis Mg chelatase CobN
MHSSIAFLLTGTNKKMVTYCRLLCITVLLVTLFPSYATSNTGVPATETSTTAVPATETSTTSVPATETSTTSVPATETSTTSVPATETPTTAVPAIETSMTSAPAIETSMTSAPAIETPTTAVPATEDQHLDKSFDDNGQTHFIYALVFVCLTAICGAIYFCNSKPKTYERLHATVAHSVEDGSTEMTQPRMIVVKQSAAWDVESDEYE